MAADLDILIRSDTDPLLYIEYHRHFTHSLFFVPFGGAICGLLLFAVLGKWWRANLKSCLLWSTIGYATHGLLDACTSYGTQLLWPFSNTRVAWDLMSIIDPIFSGLLLILVASAAFSHKKLFSYLSVIWIGIYFSFAALQHHLAVQWGRDYTASLGQQPQRLSAKPSFGNILVWKIIYEVDDRYYVLAVKPGFGTYQSWRGDSVAKLNIEKDFPWLSPNSQQAKDIARFAHFSDNHLALDPDNPLRIGDMRYSNLPHDINPLWGIELSPSADNHAHVKYYTSRNRDPDSFTQLWEMLKQ